MVGDEFPSAYRSIRPVPLKLRPLVSGTANSHKSKPEIVFRRGHPPYRSTHTHTSSDVESTGHRDLLSRRGVKRLHGRLKTRKFRKFERNNPTKCVEETGQSLRTDKPAVMFRLLWIFHSTFRGSGWAAPALGSRLALGAATSNFFCARRAPRSSIGLWVLLMGPMKSHNSQIFTVCVFPLSRELKPRMKGTALSAHCLGLG